MKCPNCNDGTLEFIEESFPYDPDHYMCNECYSTYTTCTVEDMIRKEEKRIKDEQNEER